MTRHVSRTLVLLAALALVDCGKAKIKDVGEDDSAALELVQEGYLQAYPNRTIGDAAECYFDNTSWRSLLGIDSLTYINLTGEGIDGSGTVALLQFRVFRESATFSLTGMTIDGQLQTDAVVLNFVARMFACGQSTQGGDGGRDEEQPRADL